MDKTSSFPDTVVVAGQGKNHQWSLRLWKFDEAYDVGIVTEDFPINYILISNGKIVHWGNLADLPQVWLCLFSIAV